MSVVASLLWMIIFGFNKRFGGIVVSGLGVYLHVIFPKSADHTICKISSTLAKDSWHSCKSKVKHWEPL